MRLVFEVVRYGASFEPVAAVVGRRASIALAPPPRGRIRDLVADWLRAGATPR